MKKRIITSLVIITPLVIRLSITTIGVTAIVRITIKRRILSIIATIGLVI